LKTSGENPHDQKNVFNPALPFPDAMEWLMEEKHEHQYREFDKLNSHQQAEY